MGVPFGPRLRSSLPAADPEDLFIAVSQAMALQIAADKIIISEQPVLVEDYPKDRLGSFDHTYDVILFNILSSRMAEGAKGITPAAPAIRETVPHPTDARYFQRTYGWIEEVTYQFTILAKNNSQANKLVLWFHRMMMRFEFEQKFFKARGINVFRFIGRTADEMVTSYGQDLYKRALIYSSR